jgi:MFS family permease
VRATFRQRVEAAVGGLPRHFWTLWWGLLVNRIGSFVVAFLAIYLVRDRGFTPAAAGRVLALYGLGMVAAGPLGGLLADRVGRRATMLAGLVLGALSVLALAVAQDPVVLSALAFLCSGAGDLYRPAVTAAVADLVPPRDRARAYGLVYWAINLGLSIGLALAGLVAERSLVALFVVDGVTSLLFAAAILWRVPETRPAGLVHEPALRGLARVFADGPYLSFLLLHLLALVVFSQWQLALPLDMAAQGLGPSAYAFLMALNCAGVVVLQPLLSPRLAGHDAARLLAVSVVLFGAGFGLNALGGHLAVYAVGTALWTIGEVVGFPVAATVVADLAPLALRGRYQGAFSMCWGVALTLSPLAAGETLDRLGGRALWTACLLLALAVGAGHLLTAGPRRHRLAAVAAAPDERPAAP